MTVDNGRSCYLKEAAHPDGPFLVSAYEACHSPAVAASLQTRIRNWRSSWTFYRDARRFVPQNPRWLVTHCHSEEADETIKRTEADVVHPQDATFQKQPARSRSILEGLRDWPDPCLGARPLPTSEHPSDCSEKLGLFPNPLKQSVTALAAAVFLASDAANMLQPDDAGRQA